MPYELERVITNFGILDVTIDQREVIDFVLYGQIERVDPNASFNFKYPERQGFFGYWQAIYGGAVIDTGPLQYDNDVIFRYQNNTIQAQLEARCQHRTMMFDLDTLLQHFNLQGGGEFDFVESAKVPRMPVDYFRFKLFGKTTLVLKAFGENPFNPCPDLAPDWYDPERLPTSLDGKFALPPAAVPLNEDDPLGYDLPSEAYDGDSDQGLTYDPVRNIEGTLSVTFVLDTFPGNTQSSWATGPFTKTVTVPNDSYVAEVVNDPNPSGESSCPTLPYQDIIAKGSGPDILVDGGNTCFRFRITAQSYTPNP